MTLGTPAATTSNVFAKAIVDALMELALADGLRDVRNVQGDLLDVLGVDPDRIVDCTDCHEIAGALAECGYGDLAAEVLS